MRLVFASYVKSPEYSNPESWLERLAAYFGVLEALAEHHEVISIEQIDYNGVLERNRVCYQFADFSNGRTVYFPVRLHRMIRRLDPDIVIIHGTNFPIQVLQLRSQIRKKTKIILQNHSNTLPSGFRAVLQRLADRAVDAYFFTSSSIAESWIAHKLIQPGKKIREVMVGSSIFTECERSKARSKLGISVEAKVFLWVGHLNENKDPLTVLQAFLQYAHSRPDAIMYMIYQKDELIDAVKECLTADNSGASVRLVGNVAHTFMSAWYNSADYFISGSRQEVFGAAVVEAMSCGCIPILTEIPSFKQITDNGNCGFLYCAGDRDDLMSALESTEKISIKVMREKVKRRYHEKLSFEAIAADISAKCLSL